ncbi:transcription factor Ouib [Drosophila santomea]|uniref:transcription factor Ouib n=1 Tax=Drosophila santomea TaxID=129105 RepID=UPI001952A57E|nr:transcription factor Ouib [Drosophila santomea]
MEAKVCRTCGKRTNAERSLNIFEKRNQTTLEHIKLLTGAALKNCNTLPNRLCASCQTCVQQAISFRERCLEVQRELLHSLDDEEFFKICQESPKSGFEREEHLEASQISIEIERLDDLDDEPMQSSGFKLEDILSESEIHEDEPNNDDDIGFSEVDYLIYESDPEVDEKQDLKSGSENPKKRRKRRKPCDSNGTYVCEECGNHIKGRIAFILHCKRHRGVKEFGCEFCEDRFCTPAELKRHVRRHTGEKPFKCRHCSRSFSDYSTRLKHERTHTNERPFVCKECNNAFTTSYILKNHMLVHTGEKAFKCDLCDKSFSRDTHLTTHYRSNAHRRNMQKATVAYNK